MKRIIVAIDGHSSCGKSTMARQLAGRVGYVYVDSGAMYRAVTLFALRNNLINDSDKLQEMLPQVKIDFRLNTETGKQDTYLNGENVEQEIRSLEVSSHVSPIAALPFVRQQLVGLQQRLGKDGGIVMDGRDIGTCVFPQAELKVFVTARAQVRAMRRFLELQNAGQQPVFEEILRNVEERDYIDSHRAVSPLRPAPDAILLDNSDLTPAEQLDRLLELFEQVINR